MIIDALGDYSTGCGDGLGPSVTENDLHPFCDFKIHTNCCLL